MLTALLTGVRPPVRQEDIIIVTDDPAVRRGTSIYTKPALSLYDFVVVTVSNRFIWRCASEHMLARYQRFLGRRHLDVGPGTGWYLTRTEPHPSADIALLDLNENSIGHARRRLTRAHPESIVRTYTANVLDPLPADLGTFDSVAANYLFHCVPGTWADKSVAFGHFAAALDEDGVLFGSTILGPHPDHTRAARGLMGFYNRTGVFHNQDDDAGGLTRALDRHFADVQIELVGSVALFTARRPLRTAG